MRRGGRLSSAGPDRVGAPAAGQVRTHPVDAPRRRGPAAGPAALDGDPAHRASAGGAAGATAQSQEEPEPDLATAGARPHRRAPGQVVTDDVGELVEQGAKLERARLSCEVVERRSPAR